MKKMNQDLNIKCASMKGDLSDLGKHIYLSKMGVTLCGCFTVDYDKNLFKGMPDNMTSEYQIEEWEITCVRCLEMIEVFEKASSAKKAKNN